jgi:lipopolysaccharide/colanic/teichoic acid biosynthesis glycosyltransferase
MLTLSRVRRLELATHQAQEASDARLSAVNTRALHARPHLVSSGERRAHMEVEAERTASAESFLDFRPSGLRVLDHGAVGPAVLRRGSAETRRWSINVALKRAFDILGAIVLGLVFSPMMLVIVVLMRRDKGPVIYRHRRVGRDGKVFECLKFRTMVPNADQVLRDLLERHPELKAEWLRDHKLRNDPRVTALGRFLRRTSLDELPQLWNVICGEMSLVGPRPVVKEELMRYGRNLRVYLSAKPGITGLWQVTGRNDTDYRRRVAMDVCYVRKQNLLLDLYILLKTTRVVLGGGGAY